jgi:hypothetical protein
MNEWNYIYTPMHAFTENSGTTMVHALVSEHTAVTVDCWFRTNTIHAVVFTRKTIWTISVHLYIKLRKRKYLLWDDTIWELQATFKVEIIWWFERQRERERETCWFVIASLKCLPLMFCLLLFSGDTIPSNTKMTAYVRSTCTYKNWIIFWICEYNWKVLSTSLAENKYKQKGNRDLSSCKSALTNESSYTVRSCRRINKHWCEILIHCEAGQVASNISMVYAFKQQVNPCYDWKWRAGAHYATYISYSDQIQVTSDAAAADGIKQYAINMPVRVLTINLSQ